MNRDKVYIEHIIECIEKVEEMSLEGKGAFLDNYKVRDVILRNLQVMAESTQRISQDMKESNPNVKWSQISGFRNVLVHEYMGLDMELVWAVIENDIPILKKTIKNISKKL
ncbi:MAG: DUF86 domain-containing protein [Alphaproteobacteria bacterium CG11_big_fil_rev_8_21_14_0_20_39_49]|nr:MAG: DUF86 domain-containing protein [Alphaproteobacteria bacterium CG11_big_fil_rev_8_21_14_0_20_39_49]